MRRVAWDVDVEGEEEEEGGREEVEWWRGVGRKCLFLRVFLRAAADLLPLDCLDSRSISDPSKREHAHPGDTGTPPDASSSRPSTRGRRRRPFTASGVTSQTPNLMPRKGDALSGRMRKKERWKKPQVQVPRLLFHPSFSSTPSIYLILRSHPITAQGTPSHLTLPRSHHNSSNTRSNGHRTRAR